MSPWKSITANLRVDSQDRECLVFLLWTSAPGEYRGHMFLAYAKLERLWQGLQSDLDKSNSMGSLI